MSRGSITVHHDGSWSLLIHGEYSEGVIESVRELISVGQGAIEEITPSED